MNGSAKIDISPQTLRSDDGRVQHGFMIQVNDHSLMGKSAVFEVERHVLVHDSRPVNSSKKIFSRKLVLQESSAFIPLEGEGLKLYSYKGRMIDVQIKTRIKVDDRILFDTTIAEEQEMALGSKPAVNSDSAAIIDPSDKFNLMTNLKALPYWNRVKAMILIAVGSLLIGTNTVVGIHDQTVPLGKHYFYSQVNSDGESQSPLFGAAGVDGVLGAIFWFLVMRELRQYMTFKFKPLPAVIGRDSKLKASDLVTGIPRVDLKNITIRVVACNMECGQYERGSGTKRRTISFKEPIRAGLVFEKFIPFIPKGVAVESYLEDPVSFNEMFAILYPPNTTSGSHGLAVHWEVQLLHEEFVDQELIGDPSVFRYEDFLAA